MSRNIGDLINHMNRDGSNTLFIVGDSVSLEFWNDALCSARRLSFEVVRVEKLMEGVERAFEVRRPYQTSSEGGVPAFFQVYFFSLGHIGDAFTTMPKVKIQIDSLVRNESVVRGKAVFVINTGLHYQREHHSTVEKEYKGVLAEFLKVFIPYAKDNHSVVSYFVQILFFASNWSISHSIYILYN